MYEETIKLLLRSDQEFTEKALLKLYSLQLEEEKEMKETAIYNGVGFTKGDAHFLSTASVGLIHGRELAPQMWQEIHKRMEKYATQLAQYPEIISLLR